MSYSKYTIYTSQIYPPNVDMIPFKNDLAIISIPTTLRVHFFKYAFINSGILMDIDVSSDNALDSQNGIGALLGIGVNYDFDFGASLFVNPYIKAHSLISFTSDSNPQRLMESGIRIGLAFYLNKK